MGKRPARASLLGLPIELRLNIYEHLFDYYLDDSFLMAFYMYANLYSCRHAPTNECKALNILATCRQIYQEASELLYSNAYVTICVMGTKKPEHHPRLSPIGIPEKMRVWPFIKDMRLIIMLEKGKENRRDVLMRIRRLTEHVIEGGKYLRKLNVVFTTPEDEGLPSWYPEAVVALSEMHVDGNVSVSIEEEDEDDDCCLALEEVISTPNCLVLRS